MPNDFPESQSASELPLPENAIRALDAYRHALRQYLAFSDTLLAGLKLGPRRYQAMLAIKAREAEGPLSIGTISRLLLIRPNSATELVSRLERAGLVERVNDRNDKRRQLIQLTLAGNEKLAAAASLHYSHLLDHHEAFTRLFSLEASQFPEQATAARDRV
ncbi:MAG: winged helix-turn-helix transcriptional regulator [Hyphomicrobiales bacterium]|nr:winged helix-turn-helix transcriptional regulator [Hyphomicrobiales bacterium]